MSKQTVHYTGTATFYVWPWNKNEDGSDIIVGSLERVLNHPKLGSCRDVRTSVIVTPIDEHGKFETLNTIYEPYQNS